MLSKTENKENELMHFLSLMQKTILAFIKETNKSITE